MLIAAYIEGLVVGAPRDIGREISVILSTVAGERVVHPEFGCGLQTRNVSQTSASGRKQTITEPPASGRYR